MAKCKCEEYIVNAFGDSVCSVCNEEASSKPKVADKKVAKKKNSKSK